MVWGIGVFAYGKDFCRLPLTSELDALCAANANPAPTALGLGSSIPKPKGKEKQTIG